MDGLGRRNLYWQQETRNHIKSNPNLSSPKYVSPYAPRSLQYGPAALQVMYSLSSHYNYM